MNEQSLIHSNLQLRSGTCGQKILTTFIHHVSYLILYNYYTFLYVHFVLHLSQLQLLLHNPPHILFYLREPLHYFILFFLSFAHHSFSLPFSCLSRSYLTLFLFRHLIRHPISYSSVFHRLEKRYVSELTQATVNESLFCRFGQPASGRSQCGGFGGQ